MSTLPVPTFEDNDSMRYAMGTLQLRKRHNRKRSSTGELIWNDWADVALALGLITWTGNPSYRIGIRRSLFLQHFLGSRGIKKTRKQISSRLQVLKSEWNDTQYLELLIDPNKSENPCLRNGATGFHHAQTTSNNTPGINNVNAEPLQGTSSFHVILPPDSPESRRPEAAAWEYCDIHPAPRTTEPLAVWSPPSSYSPTDFESNLPIPGPTYTNAVTLTEFNNPTSGHYAPVLISQYI